MPKRDLTIAMVGAGGDGIVTMGDILAQAAAREGLNVLKTEAYGPQIRGGESSCIVRLSADPIYESGRRRRRPRRLQLGRLRPVQGRGRAAKNAVVLFDEADPVAAPPRTSASARRRSGSRCRSRSSSTDSGAKGSKNIVGLGVLTALFGLPADTLRRAVESTASAGRRRPSARAT